MKGKKINTEFVTNFINNCIIDGKISSNEIVSLAKESIVNIDSKIKEINNLKINRSNLLDVISSFETPSNKNNIDDIKKLSYCIKIENKNMDINQICYDLSDLFSKSEIIFNIKQLVCNKILHKINEVILRGDNYEDYMKVICNK
jgi:hypothetical protein